MLKKSFALVSLLLATVLISAAVFACSTIVRVSFETGGGSFVNSQTLSTGSKAKEPDEPTKEGYTFDGWYSDPLFNNDYKFSTKVRKDTVLYAKWKINTYTIFFVTEGSPVDDMRVEYNQIPELYESYLSGHIFKGWYTDSECKNPFDSAMPPNDITLYAGWQPDDNYSPFTFEKNPNGYTLTSVRDIKLSFLSVPDTFNNQPVTRIGKSAFKSAKQMLKLHIPDSVTVIGDSAFEGMNALTTVTLPQLTSFAQSMFYGCANLSEITIPDTVKTIGKNVFYGCTSLTQITLPSGLTEIGDTAFYGCGFTSITMPQGITTISAGLFYGCDKLDTVEFLGEVKQINDGAFEGCVSLENIDLKDGLVSLGERAFADSGLKAVTLPSSLKTAGDYLFKRCVNLASVRFNGSTSLGDGVFLDCTMLTDVTLPNKLTSIGISFFENCDSLENIDLPDTVLKLGESAFRNCLKLKEINLPDGITKLSDGVFEGCENLKNVILPLSLTEIGSSVFINCFSLLNMDLPEGLKAIGYRAFYGCEKIDNFNFGTNLVQIGGQAFYGTGWLNNKHGDVYAGKVLYLASKGETVLREDTVSIAGYAFSANKTITSIDIADTVEYIGECAFEGSEIENISLPASLKEIGAYAFRNNKRLITVEFNSGATVGTGAFLGCTSLTDINLTALYNIPDNMLSGCTSLTFIEISSKTRMIGKNAFFGASKLSQVVINNGLELIETSSFEGCESLKTISLPDSVAVIMPFAFKNSGLYRVNIGTGILSIGEQAFVTKYSSIYSTQSMGMTVMLLGSPLIGMNSFSPGAQLKIIAPDELYNEIKNEQFSHPIYENWKIYKNCVYSHNMIEGEFVLNGSRLIAYLGEESSIIIPDIVTEISAYTFCGSDFIKQVSLNPLLNVIGDYAFCGTGITRLNFSSNVLSIGKKAFFVKSYLVSITINIDRDTAHSPAVLGDEAFRVKGYHLLKSGGSNYYKFSGDDNIYDVNGEIVADTQLSVQLKEGFEQKSGEPLFINGIITIGRADQYAAYRQAWTAYTNYISL